jgi:hypothetical protein
MSHSLICNWSQVWFALGRFYIRYDIQILKSKPFEHSLAIQDCAIPQNQKQYFRYSQIKPHQINPIGATETCLRPWAGGTERDLPIYAWCLDAHPIPSSVWALVSKVDELCQQVLLVVPYKQMTAGCTQGIEQTMVEIPRYSWSTSKIKPRISTWVSHNSSSCATCA